MNYLFVVMKVDTNYIVICIYVSITAYTPLKAPPGLVIPGPLQTDTWISLGEDYQVWISQESMHFLDAIAHCNAMNSTLFEAETPELFEVVTDAARRAGAHRIWLGFTDVAEEGVLVNMVETKPVILMFFSNSFRYVTTSKEVAFTNWEANQPDDFGPGGEDYADVQVATKKMNDIEVDRVGRHAVCIKTATATALPLQEMIGNFTAATAPMEKTVLEGLGSGKAWIDDNIDNFADQELYLQYGPVTGIKLRFWQYVLTIQAR